MVVGVITDKIANKLGITLADDRTIYLGKTNKIHMQAEHPEAYAVYGAKIPDILSSPDYIRLNKKDGSVEYVKEFTVNNEFVKIAVRVSSGGKYFARSLYVLNSGRVSRFIQRGELLPLD